MWKVQPVVRVMVPISVTTYDLQTTCKAVEEVPQCYRSHIEIKIGGSSDKWRTLE